LLEFHAVPEQGPFLVGLATKDCMNRYRRHCAVETRRSNGRVANEVCQGRIGHVCSPVGCLTTVRPADGL